MIQSNAFESNASANADESNANAAITGESNASASANAAFALAFANASAFEHTRAVSHDTVVNIKYTYTLYFQHGISKIVEKLFAII